MQRAEMVECGASDFSEYSEQHKWQVAPSFLETMLLFLLSAILFVSTIVLFRRYGDAVYNFGDSHAYTSVATAIRQWDFRGVQIKQFWGYPYLIAVVSLLTRIPDQDSLVLVSFMGSFISLALAYQLWGGWVSGPFALLNFDWMQRSFLGGAEPLAVVLIFGTFMSVRRERYLLGVLLASLSTVVRPLGICSLIGIGTILVYRREYVKLGLAVLIGTVVGTLYVLPLVRYFGDPLATVHSYQGMQHSLFGVPFYAIIEGTILYPVPWTNLVLDFGWILLVLAGATTMFFSPKFREYAKQNPAEILFAVPYLLMVFCYNYPVFARSNFARFAIPALPVVFVALSTWVPKDRRVLWALGVLMPILAASSALGIRNVIHALRG